MTWSLCTWRCSNVKLDQRKSCRLLILNDSKLKKTTHLWPKPGPSTPPDVKKQIYPYSPHLRNSTSFFLPRHIDLCSPLHQISTILATFQPNKLKVQYAGTSQHATWCDVTSHSLSHPLTPATELAAAVSYNGTKMARSPKSVHDRFFTYVSINKKVFLNMSLHEHPENHPHTDPSIKEDSWLHTSDKHTFSFFGEKDVKTEKKRTNDIHVKKTTKHQF